MENVTKLLQVDITNKENEIKNKENFSKFFNLLHHVISTISNVELISCDRHKVSANVLYKGTVAVTVTYEYGTKKVNTTFVSNDNHTSTLETLSELATRFVYLDNQSPAIIPVRKYSHHKESLINDLESTYKQRSVTYAEFAKSLPLAIMVLEHLGYAYELPTEIEAIEMFNGSDAMFCFYDGGILVNNQHTIKVDNTDLQENTLNKLKYIIFNDVCMLHEFI